MWQLIAGNKNKKILLFLFVAAVAYWLVFISVNGYKTGMLAIYTQLPLVVIPIVGGVMGLNKFFKGAKVTSFGSGLLCLSLGMVVWGVGLGMWTYYIWQGTTVPYPSLADYVFIWSPVLWVVGLISLSRVVGGPYGLQRFSDWVIGLVTTLLVAVGAYYLLVVVVHGNILGAPGETSMQLFFDYAYTAEILAVTTIVGAMLGFSRKYLGGRYRGSVILLSMGFVTHFLAFVFFADTIAKGTYFNGNVADVLYTIAVFLESLGIVNLDTKYISDGSGN